MSAYVALWTAGGIAIEMGSYVRVSAALSRTTFTMFAVGRSVGRPAAAQKRAAEHWVCLSRMA